MTASLTLRHTCHCTDSLYRVTCTGLYSGVWCGVCTTGTGQSEASLRGVTAETGTLISPLSLSLSERRDEKGRARLNIVSRVRGDG